MSVALDFDDSFWINCPSDILILIFKSLDINSLINCMHVNKTWSDTVYYYCQHYNLWGKLLEKISHKNGLSYGLKSQLNDKHLFLSALNWLSIQNSHILPCHKYSIEKIRSMCMLNEMLFVTSNLSLNFIDIRQKKMIKRLEHMCLEYIETRSLIAELTLPNLDVIGYNALTLINKLHTNVCECTDVKKIILFDISLFKVHVNTCYVIDIKNVLWLYTAEECCWDTKVLARYYGNKESITLIHVYIDDVYVLLKTGDILKLDRKCKKFEKLLNLDIPHYLLDKELFMFHKYSLIVAVPSDKTYESYPSKEHNQSIFTCPGLTCLLEHGPVLITGFENGMVKIFVIDKLLKNEILPALQFRLDTYMSLQSYKIIAIEVYEDNDGHHMFLATDDNICELLM
nr:uncharacterized protein LOC116766010 isoform X1 [Danaus plexippus plexippus]